MSRAVVITFSDGTSRWGILRDFGNLELAPGSDDPYRGEWGEEWRQLWRVRPCPYECTGCSGHHHWIEYGPDDDEDPHAAELAGHEVWYGCKHCDAWVPDLP